MTVEKGHDNIAVKTDISLYDKAEDRDKVEKTLTNIQSTANLTKLDVDTQKKLTGNKL